jgi:hypothetical protein
LTHNVLDVNNTYLSKTAMYSLAGALAAVLALAGCTGSSGGPSASEGTPNAESTTSSSTPSAPPSATPTDTESAGITDAVAVDAVTIDKVTQETVDGAAAVTVALTFVNSATAPTSFADLFEVTAYQHGMQMAVTAPLDGPMGDPASPADPGIAASFSISFVLLELDVTGADTDVTIIVSDVTNPDGEPILAQVFSPGPLACRGNAVDLSLDATDGTNGWLRVTFSVTNTAAGPCALDGAPGVDYFDGAGTLIALAEVMTPPFSAATTLEPGQSAQFTVANPLTEECPVTADVARVQILLPGDGFPVSFDLPAGTPICNPLTN